MNNSIKEKQDILLTMLSGIHEEHHVLRLIKICSEMLTGTWVDAELQPRSIAIKPIVVRKARVPITVLDREFRSQAAALRFFGIENNANVYRQLKDGLPIEDLIPDKWYNDQPKKLPTRKILKNGVLEIPSDIRDMN